MTFPGSRNKHRFNCVNSNSCSLYGSRCQHRSSTGSINFLLFDVDNKVKAGSRALPRRTASSLSDGVLTEIISTLSDSCRLLHMGYSIFRNLLVHCTCCWIRLFVGVRVADKIYRTVAKVLDVRHTVGCGRLKMNCILLQ